MRTDSDECMLIKIIHVYCNFFRNDNFHMKNLDMFLNFAKDRERGYTLEPPYEVVLTNTHNLCLMFKSKK